jgi:hypothetical protein
MESFRWEGSEMQRLVLVLVISGLLAAGITHEAAAGAPSSESDITALPCGLVSPAIRVLLVETVATLPPPGARVEVPEAGIAVTFPDEWQVEVRMDPVDLDHPHGPAELLRPDDRAWDVLRAVAPHGASCQVQLYQTNELMLQDVAAWFQRLGDVMPDYETAAPRYIQLPAGTAMVSEVIHYDYEESPGPEPENEPVMESPRHVEDARAIYKQHVAYVLGRGDAIAMLICDDQEPPSDRWLSIAETFEFLPPVE